MKSLIIIIVKYLRGQLESNQLSPSAAEGVEVAVQCLEDAYDIIPADLQRSVLSLEDLLRATVYVPEDGEQITAEHKEQAENLKLVGNNLMREEKFTEAIDTYTRAIEIDPYNAVYYCNRAAAHIQQKNYIAGVNDCGEAVRLDPAYSKAYSRMGYSYQAMGNKGKARDCYERAVKLEPQNEGYKASLKKVQEMPGTSAGSYQQPGDIMNMLPGVDLSSIIKNPSFMQMASQMLEDPGLQTAVSRILAGQSSFPLANVQELISAGHQLADHLRSQRSSGVNEDGDDDDDEEDENEDGVEYENNSINSFIVDQGRDEREQGERPAVIPVLEQRVPDPVPILEPEPVANNEINEEIEVRHNRGDGHFQGDDSVPNVGDNNQHEQNNAQEPGTIVLNSRGAGDASFPH